MKDAFYMYVLNLKRLALEVLVVAVVIAFVVLVAAGILLAAPGMLLFIFMLRAGVAVARNKCLRAFQHGNIGFQMSFRQFFQLLDDHLIVHAVAVPVKVRAFHQVCDLVDQLVLFITVRIFPCFRDDLLHGFAVMLVADIVMRVFQQFGLGLECFAGWLRVWGIHIELKIGNNEQVIPELVLEIGDIA